MKVHKSRQRSIGKEKGIHATSTQFLLLHHDFISYKNCMYIVQFKKRPFKKRKGPGHTSKIETDDREKFEDERAASPILLNSPCKQALLLQHTCGTSPQLSYKYHTSKILQEELGRNSHSLLKTKNSR